MTKRIQAIAERFERPRQPEPVVLRIDYEVDPWLRSDLRDDAAYIKHVKRCLVNRIAEALVKNTQFVSDESLLANREVVSIEITLNDRGTYQNWLPQERQAGRAEGGRRVIDALPYGINFPEAQ